MINIQEKYLSIAEASNLLQVSLDTIRRWEKKGLIKAHRSNLGHRIFQVDELSRLQLKLSKGSSDNEYKVLFDSCPKIYTVVELFAGAGGLALGMDNAGLECKMLVEIDKIATQNLRINRPNWNVIENDITKINFSNVTADIVAGGFPCQAFSYAGKKLGFDDTRGTLFFEYARAVKEINPKIILAENVRGLERHDEGRTLSTMMQVLDDLGYNMSYRVLRAQYLDVAQKRERNVIIGLRKDYKAQISFPQEQGYTISLREALKDVPCSGGQSYTISKKKVMELIPEGGYWRDLPDELQRSFMGASYFLGGGKTGMARRLSWDEPSLTLIPIYNQISQIELLYC